MRNNSVTLLSRVKIVAALVLAFSLVSDSRAWQRPATPCPCAADGACQPQGPWGFTGTKWRPWPGDVITPPPLSAGEAETREQLQLDPFELPTPEKEGERGPKTTKRPKAGAGGAAAPQPETNDAPEPAVPLPDDVGLPEVGPLPGGEPEGGAAAPDDFGLEAPAAEPEPALEQPPAVQPPAADEEPVESAPPQETDQPEETPEPAAPGEEFDPFSQIDEPSSAPPQPMRRGTPAISREDAPPKLPASLRKLGRAGSAARPTARDSRYVQSAGLVQ